MCEACVLYGTRNNATFLNLLRSETKSTRTRHNNTIGTGEDKLWHETMPRITTHVVQPTEYTHMTTSTSTHLIRASYYIQTTTNAHRWTTDIHPNLTPSTRREQPHPHSYASWTNHKVNTVHTPVSTQGLIPATPSIGELRACSRSAGGTLRRGDTGTAALAGWPDAPVCAAPVTTSVTPPAAAAGSAGAAAAAGACDVCCGCVQLQVALLCSECGIRDVLQIGHTASTLSHAMMQSLWNMWRQLRCITD